MDPALLRAILENPDDDLPRLLMADYLEENEQPARAAFIRVQCELAHRIILNSDRQKAHNLIERFNKRAPVPMNGTTNACLLLREHVLFQNNYTFWAWHIPEARFLASTQNGRPTASIMERDSAIGTNQSFVRGFIEQITCTADGWFAYANAITLQHPIRRVTLTGGQVPWNHDGDEYYMLIGLGPTMRYGRRVRLRRGLGQTEIIRAVLQAEWPNIEFTLPESQDSRSRRDRLIADTVAMTFVRHDGTLVSAEPLMRIVGDRIII